MGPSGAPVARNLDKSPRIPLQNGAEDALWATPIRDGGVGTPPPGTLIRTQSNRKSYIASSEHSVSIVSW